MESFSGQDDIQSFWKWFISISQLLYIDTTNTEILKNLDYKIKKLGPFDWEIGPIGESLYLAISPNLNQELVEITSKIISCAPICENWIFFNAKPRKEYHPTLSLLNEQGRKIQVDTSSWMYILYYFDDGTFDVDIKIGQIDGDVNTQKLALDIALTNILGEEKFMHLFRNIQIVQDTNNYSNTFTLFKYLNKHVDSFLRTENN